MSRKAPAASQMKIAAATRVAIVAARWNAEIVDELLRGCREKLIELGVKEKNIIVHRVPGAYELPFAARVLAEDKKIEGIIAIGCVIRGDTPHFDYVAGECARGIMQVNLLGKAPVIFGVLTVNTEQQAKDRCGGSHSHAGKQAAEAAVEMIAFKRVV